jgi:hypothetical protein
MFKETAEEETMKKWCDHIYFDAMDKYADAEGSWLCVHIDLGEFMTTKACPVKWNYCPICGEKKPI